MVGRAIVCVWALDSTESRVGELSTKCTGVHYAPLVDCIESRGGELSIRHMCVHLPLASLLQPLETTSHVCATIAECSLSSSESRTSFSSWRASSWILAHKEKNSHYQANTDLYVKIFVRKPHSCWEHRTKVLVPHTSPEKSRKLTHRTVFPMGEMDNLFFHPES